MPSERYQELLSRSAAATEELLPPDLAIWDAHTHLGVDEDGFRLAPEELLGAMAENGAARAFVFPLNDPERAPAYRVPNDRVLGWAEQSEGRLVPFCRLDLRDGPLEEAERCLARGARGIKLHPRAQRFTFGERELDPVFTLAAEHRVPVLIHAGRGLPPIADDLRRLVEHHGEAQLILAHCAIADLEVIGRTLLEHPNVVYDTSVWSLTDLHALLARVSPEQIVYATDMPYGHYASSKLQVATLLHLARAPQATVRGIFWENAERIARGEPAAELSPPLLPAERTLSMQRARVHEYLVMATALLWSRQADVPGVMGLARRACDAADDERLQEAAEALEEAERLWLAAAAAEREEDAFPLRRCALRMIQLALVAVLVA